MVFQISVAFLSPASTYHRFLTGLTGDKMSSSKPSTAIYLNDDTKDEVKKVKKTTNTSVKTYIREDVCGIFEMDYTEENAEKYAHIIENVKKYVKKMMED